MIVFLFEFYYCFLILFMFLFVKKLIYINFKVIALVLEGRKQNQRRLNSNVYNRLETASDAMPNIQ
jgi:hypothetical protein